MTYGELSYRATKLYTKGKITLDKYMEMTKPLNREIEQEPKTGTGRWIEVIDEIDSLGNKTWHHKCSICGNENSGWGNYKYCPNCGARMESEEV